MTLEQRIAELERSVRLSRLGFLLIAVAASALALSGFLKVAPPPDLVANSLKIVDSHGRAAIDMRTDAKGHAHITLLSTNPNGGIYVTDADKLTCKANMQTLANAVQAYRVKTRVSVDQILEMGLAAAIGNGGDLSMMPVCPKGGEYSIEQGEKAAYRLRCSNPTHGTFEPGKD